MASVVCSSDFLVVTSGSRMKVLSFSEPTSQVIHDLKVTPPEPEQKKGKDGKKKEKEQESDKTPGEQQVTGIDPHIPTGRILAASFSTTGQHFAACTDQKELTVWSTRPAWTKLWTKSVTKRCMAVTFDTNETALYVADKSGDVYRYAIADDTKEPALILGHVSMLLDVVVSPDDRFIMTGERDEKIRVSHLPNAYNVHTFCLGHTQFVSRLAMLPNTDFLISAAGDSSIRLWDYMSGSELCSTTLDWAGQGDAGDKDKATVTCIACSKHSSLFAVLVLHHSCVPVYQVTEKDGRWSIDEVTRIQCTQPPWSVTFDPDGHLLILLPDAAKSLLVYNAEKDADNSIKVTEELSSDQSALQLAQRVRDDWEFLKCSCDIPSIFQGLHKVPFDNMPDYLQRKQERIETTQAKRGRRRKWKTNKGQKRSNDDVVGDDGDHSKRTMHEHEDDDNEDDEEDNIEEEETEEMEIGKD